MINLYWPVYKNLENRIQDILFNIHVDDKQLNVYSSNIADLILRSAVEIESISKELYYINCPNPKTNVRFDDECIKYLNSSWGLQKKVVTISSPNIYVKEKRIYPFLKNEKKTSKDYLTFGWNNAYQNIKHNRANSIEFGKIKNLIDIMAALFLLNIYYKNEKFKLERHFNLSIFPKNFGSDLFSLDLSGSVILVDYSDLDFYDSFFSSTYHINFNEYFKKTFRSPEFSLIAHLRDQFQQHPLGEKYLENTGSDINNLRQEEIINVLGESDFKEILNKAEIYLSYLHGKIEYELVLNKQPIPSLS